MRSARPRECASARPARSALARRRGSARAPSARGARISATAHQRYQERPAFPRGPLRLRCAPRTTHLRPASSAAAAPSGSVQWSSLRVPGPPFKHFSLKLGFLASTAAGRADFQGRTRVHESNSDGSCCGGEPSWVLLAIAWCERRCLGGWPSSCLACRSWMVGADGA
ncbi:MAG: hypothetical protein ACPIOQ_52550 [Promethearchaeia archaeon]